MPTIGAEYANVRNTSCFSKSNMQRLQELMYEKTAERGTVLFWEGDAAKQLFFVHRGAVRLVKTSEEGKQLTMSLYKPGDLFGQIDPYRESAQSCTAEMAEDGAVGIVQRSDLEVLLWRHGDFAVEFMRWMGLIQRIHLTKVRDLMSFGKSGALSSVLIRLSNTYGAVVEDGIRIERSLTHTELADMIGSSREGVNRTIMGWKREGILDMRDGFLVIHHLDALRAICRCEDCPAGVCRM